MARVQPSIPAGGVTRSGERGGRMVQFPAALTLTLLVIYPEGGTNLGLVLLSRCGGGCFGGTCANVLVGCCRKIEFVQNVNGK